MSYDQEFETYWAQYDDGPLFKSIAYAAWQAAKAPAQPEVKKLEPEFGDYGISADGSVFAVGHLSNHTLSKFGRERKTPELAEAAAEKMRKRDRLHAFVTEHCGYEYEWKKGVENCYIYHDHDDKHWYISYDSNVESIERIYMPRETAEYLCAVLNDGRLVL